MTHIENPLTLLFYVVYSYDYYDRNDNLIRKTVVDHMKGSRSYRTTYDEFDGWEYKY